MGSITLITGGSRSGKSSRALRVAEEHASGGALYFIATAEPLDDEMRVRIQHHRSARPRAFTTIEEPIELAAAMGRIDGKVGAAVIDCITLWLSNLIGRELVDNEVFARADQLVAAAAKSPLNWIIVTDEVGSGIVPTEHGLARRFRDLLGWTNQRLAAAAETVTLMVSGIPMRIK